jgi:hypothetical protein
MSGCGEMVCVPIVTNFGGLQDLRRTYFAIPRVPRRFLKGSPKDPRELPESFAKASRKVPESFAKASRKVPESFPKGSRELPERFPRASRELPESFAGASRELLESFPKGSREVPEGLGWTNLIISNKLIVLNRNPTMATVALVSPPLFHYFENLSNFKFAKMAKRRENASLFYLCRRISMNTTTCLIWRVYEISSFQSFLFLVRRYMAFWHPWFSDCYNTMASWEERLNKIIEKEGFQTKNKNKNLKTPHQQEVPALARPACAISSVPVMESLILAWELFCARRPVKQLAVVGKSPNTSTVNLRKESLWWVTFSLV